MVSEACRATSFRFRFSGSIKRVTAVITGVAALSAALPASAWPQYHGQALFTTQGVLLDWSNGNKAGGLEIRLPNGNVQLFSTSLRTTWAHGHISCRTIPDGTLATKCADWPSSFVRNSTKVVVTYWNDINTGPGVPGPILVAKDVSRA